MSEREKRDRALWRRLRAERRDSGAGEARAPDALLLAAYLDGTLDEVGRAEIEAWLAAAPEGVELMLAARQAVAEPDVAPPERVVQRAAALVPDRPRGSLAAWLAGFLMPLWQPLGWSGAVAGVLLACVVGFQLGQSEYQSTVALEELEVADAGFMFDPADDEIL